MSTAFTGLLEGFTKTKLALDERDRQREKDQNDLDLRKQDLDLKRKILAGELASRQLQDQMHALNVQDLVIKLGKQIRDQDARNALKDPAVTPDATGATTPSLATGGTPAQLQATPDAGADPGAITQTPLSPSPHTGTTLAAWRTVQPTPAILTAARREGQAAGVPVEHLLGLGAVESAMDPNARGPMTRFGWQAQGYGQLSPDTGKRFGVQDPYNLDQNMMGTAKAWKEALQKAHGDPRVAYQRYYNPGADDATTDKVLFSMARFRELGTDPTATPDLSQQVAGPGAPRAPVIQPTPTSPATVGTPSAPTTQAPLPPGQASTGVPPTATRLPADQLAWARAVNPERQQLAQAEQALTQLEALRQAKQEDARNRGYLASPDYEKLTAAFDKRHAELTAERNRLLERVEPKTAEAQFFFDRYGLYPSDAKAIPGLVQRGLAEFDAQKTTTTKGAEDAFKLTQPLLEADPKHDYLDLATGQKVNATMTYGEAQARIKDGTVKAFPLLTGEQAKAYNYGSRANQANRLINALEAQGVNDTSLMPYFAQRLDHVIGAIGAVGGTIIGYAGGPIGAGAGLFAGGKGGADVGAILADPLANALRSPQEQQYYQGKLDFISAVLRKESGAAISMGEFRSEDRRYFPQPGDAEAVLKQKAAARDQVLKALQQEAGERPLLQPQPVALAEKPAVAAPPTPPTGPGAWMMQPPTPARAAPYAAGGPQGPQNEQVLFAPQAPAPAATSPGPRLEGLSPEQIYNLPKPQLDALVQQADLDTLTKEQRGILFLRYPQQR